MKKNERTDKAPKKASRGLVNLEHQVTQAREVKKLKAENSQLRASVQRLMASVESMKETIEGLRAQIYADEPDRPYADMDEFTDDLDPLF